MPRIRNESSKNEIETNTDNDDRKRKCYICNEAESQIQGVIEERKKKIFALKII